MPHGEDRIREALSKKSEIGSDIDIDAYESNKDAEVIDDLNSAPEDIRTDMINVGISSDDTGKAGTFMFIGNSLSHCSNKVQEGLEMITTQEALAKYDWAKDYIWNAVKPDKDKYTAKTYLEDSDGYFIWVKPGYHIKDPVQTCMLIRKKKSVQNVHNIIIVDEGASLELLTGCTTDTHANDALHIGVSEIYVKKNASVTFSMIHNWGKDTAVRPRTAAILEEGASYVNNYVILEPVGTLQSNPVAYLNGRGATCKFNTICVAQKGSDIDSGGVVVLNAPETSAELMSRSITKGGRMIARGRLVGNADGAKAHLECRSIVLEDGGLTLAIPELESTVADVEMTHEAAVGKIARDQIEYLMSRGLTEDDAVSMIVRGFLVGGIRGLPEHLEREINETIEKANLGN